MRVMFWMMKASLAMNNSDMKKFETDFGAIATNARDATRNYCGWLFFTEDGAYEFLAKQDEHDWKVSRYLNGELLCVYSIGFTVQDLWDFGDRYIDLPKEEESEMEKRVVYKYHLDCEKIERNETIEMALYHLAEGLAQTLSGVMMLQKLFSETKDDGLVFDGVEEDENGSL